jgi:hypothetical protein
MDSNNIIKIIPNLYIADKSLTDNNILKAFNIKFIINVNSIKKDIDEYTVYELVINENEKYLSNINLNINYEILCDFIIYAFKNESSILIIDENFMIPMLIVGIFLMKFMKISFIETIYWLYYKLKINSELNKNILFHLFNYYKKMIEK